MYRSGRGGSYVPLRRGYSWGKVGRSGIFGLFLANVDGVSQVGSHGQCMRLSALVHVVPRRACAPMFCGTPPGSLSPGLATFYPPIFMLLNPFCVFVFCVFSAGLTRF